MRALAVFAVAALVASSAYAAPPTKEQQAEFYKTCMRIAENDTLCSCKRDAAVELIDSDFMTTVISAMKGETYPADEQGTYDAYISRSNAVCIPGY
jgi:hypothetical protein